MRAFFIYIFGNNLLRLKNKIPQLILLLLYVVSGYMYSPEVIDRISLQWLFLTVLNIFTSFFLIIYHFEKIKTIRFSFNKILLFVFTIWACLSCIYAINQAESIINSTRWINISIGLINFYLLLGFFKNKFQIISSIICVMLVYEVFFTIHAYLSIIDYAPYNFSLANNLRGVTANKNITAASFITKMPFVIYLFISQKIKLIKILCGVLLYSLVFALFLLGSRATYFSFLLIIVFTILFLITLLFNDKKRNIKDLINGLLIVFAVVTLSFISSSYALRQSEVSVGNRISTINMTDTSTTQRLRYYRHAIDHILSNPILGTGIGNWKIKSVEYDRENMTGYTVPYHMHNDFLQFASELGIIGFLLYLGIFINIGIKSLQYTFSKSISIDKKLMYLTILSSISAYFIDSNLNFPYARVINLIVFIIIINLFDYLKESES